MGKVKQHKTDVQYIKNVLSAHGETTALEAFENVLKHSTTGELDTFGDPITIKRKINLPTGMSDSNNNPITVGQQLSNVGEVRQIMADLDDHDIVCLETIDEHGDTQDLYPMYIDVIDNVKLTNDTMCKEIRFCQMNQDIWDQEEKDKEEKEKIILIDRVMTEYYGDRDRDPESLTHKNRLTFLRTRTNKQLEAMLKECS